MDSLVEENGNLDPLSEHETGNNEQNNSSSNYDVKTVLTTSGGNIVQFIPSSSIQSHSVIQANQSSVIQTATATSNPNTVQKRVVYINKPNSVIHTAAPIQVHIKPEPNSQHNLDTNSDDSVTDDDSPNRRREFIRRPSYHKILKDISTPDLAGQLPMQIAESGGISAISPGAGIICQDSSQFYISNNTNMEDQTRKREIRLQKNREAARECRRKKKEYIKCLENRVAVLENQNKALIDELKSLKELYCQTKND